MLKRKYIANTALFILFWFIGYESVGYGIESFLLASGIFLIFHVLKDRHPLSSKQKRKRTRDMREMRLNNELELDSEEQRRWNDKKRVPEQTMEQTRRDD